jgi:hypothetical protein
MHGLKRKFTVSGLKTYCEKNELTIHRFVQCTKRHKVQFPYEGPFAIIISEEECPNLLIIYTVNCEAIYGKSDKANEGLEILQPSFR